MRTDGTEGSIIPSDEDGDVLIRIRAGETDAYGELVRRHAPIATRTAVLLGAGPDADDVVQDAFVKAYRALGRFRDGAAFRPWLLQIVANEARNAHRTAVRRGNREETAALLTTDLLYRAGDAADPVRSVLATDRRARLLGSVRELPEPYRLVVTCRYLLDLDEAETATVLGWPRGTVKSRLHRALTRLRAELGSGEVVTDA